MFTLRLPARHIIPTRYLLFLLERTDQTVWHSANTFKVNNFLWKEHTLHTQWEKQNGYSSKGREKIKILFLPATHIVGWHWSPWDSQLVPEIPGEYRHRISNIKDRNKALAFQAVCRVKRNELKLILLVIILRVMLCWGGKTDTATLFIMQLLKCDIF